MEPNLDLDDLFNDIRQKLDVEYNQQQSLKTDVGLSAEEVVFRETEDIDKRLDENYKFLNNNLSKRIDSDIQQMRFELNKTYEIFKSTAETLETIHFNNISNRIKDLHMYPEDKELESIVLDSVNKTNIPELNKIMEDKFRNHPGEFGNIPEVSKFFQACSQLQHGLKEMDESREKINDLKKKVDWASLVTLQKIDHLKTSVNKECEKAGANDTPLKMNENLIIEKKE